MDLGGRSVITTRKGVAAGSVWESRMKLDEVKGGIKVFNGEENSKENGESSNRMRPKQSPIGVSGKRKTWKSESSERFERNPIQIAKQRSELNKNLDEQFKQLSVSADGIRKTPIQIKKKRSEVGMELSESVDGIERNPFQKLRIRSKSQKGFSECSDGIERTSIPLRKVKLESSKGLDEIRDGIERNYEIRKSMEEYGNGNGGNSIQLMKGKSTVKEVLDECGGNLNGFGSNSVELGKDKFESHGVFEGFIEEFEKSPIGISKTRSNETSKELVGCDEKVITSNLDNVGRVESSPKLEVFDYKDGIECDEEDWDQEDKGEIEIEIEKKSCDVKEVDIAELKPKIILIEEKKIHQINEKKLPISPIVRKQPTPIVKSPRIIPKPTKTKSVPVSEEFQRVPQTHNKLQSLVDLVTWSDVSKSAFVFGIGTFIIIASSYTRDLNISLISIVSYLGLVYLAAIFLFRSFICRGAIDIDDTRQEQDYVVGEEEAIWLLKLILPYMNEFLLKLRALFSGDPATTMKLAILLFVLARCGSSITIWKMAKLGFFGVFTVPKVCWSYSSQLRAYGRFWIQRFRDAWESCSHKKAVAFGIFTLVWNLSSIVARIWAVFMLFVAFRCYKHSLMREDWVEKGARGSEDNWQGQIGGHRQRCVSSSVEIKKQTKKT